jgi:hypothetical protein
MHARTHSHIHIHKHTRTLTLTHTIFSGCLPLSQSHFCEASQATWIEDGCCAECSAFQDCHSCADTQGCGWSFDLGQCISGTPQAGLCQATQWSIIHNSFIEDNTCKAVPGAVLVATGEEHDVFNT